jgi:hypothetical protein
MQKGPLNSIIQDYKYLYTIPLFWTRRHEKVLHVLWQSLQAPSCPLSAGLPPSHSSQRPSPRRRKQQTRQEATQRFRRKIEKNPRWVHWWKNQHEHLLSSLYLFRHRPTLSLLPFSFELVAEDPLIISEIISDLRGESTLVPCTRRGEAMQILLSGVDRFDTLRIRNCLSPSQSILRVRLESLEIMCKGFYGLFLSVLAF